MTFGNWPEDIHATAEQQKRLESAKSPKTTPICIEKESKEGIFPGRGSSDYHTTLEFCTCVDFARRKLPCKHIYRLAIELGKLKESVQIGINKNILIKSQIEFKDAIAELENLSDNCQYIFKNFLEQSLTLKTAEFPVLVNRSSDELLSCTLLKQINAPDVALQIFKRNQIIQILDAHNISGFKRNAGQTNLISWCLENIEGIWEVFPRIYVFQFSEYFQKARKKVYTYLRRKYDWASFYNDDMRRMKYPYGAQSGGFSVIISTDLSASISRMEDPNKHYFPNDEITQLLTFYGHNRCADGYVPQLDNSIFYPGRVFVLTGDFSLFTRDEAIGWLESKGAKVSGSLSAKTDYLIIGENPNSGKLQRAEATRIPVLSEQDFWKMMQ